MSNYCGEKLLLFLNPPRAYRLMIIDIHTHNHFKSWTQLSYPSPEEDADLMLQIAATEHGVEKLCLLGRFYPYPDEEGVRRINDQTIAMVKHRPNKLFGLAFLNPALPENFLRQEVTRCLDAGLSGVKLEFEVNARDSRLDPIMEIVAERNVFLLHHAWYKTVDLMGCESSPSDIAHLARRHPRARILMAHLTGSGIHGVLDIKDCDNVWLDTSGGQPFSGLVDYAVKKLGSQRVVYGSDYPARCYESQLGRIYDSGLNASERECVLRKNAEYLLGINSKG